MHESTALEGMRMIQLDEKGLVSAIVQDDATGRVLMLGYMNPESLERTLNGENVWFYSRSRSELWLKGDTSGNFLKVKSLHLDCDGDAILVKADPIGPTCHTGEESCFFTPLTELTEVTTRDRGPGITDELFALIQSRQRRDAGGKLHGRALRAGCPTHRTEGHRGGGGDGHRRCHRRPRCLGLGGRRHDLSHPRTLGGGGSHP